MSYPYGPEPYPTWDELERWHDDFRTALYAEHEHACETMLPLHSYSNLFVSRSDGGFLLHRAPLRRHG